MTECDKIKERGQLEADFFKAEYKCDYYVDEQMKKIWAIELDLYLEFERVCKKHGLKYFLLFGSLIGAVRHKGFIPWDDDIDVGMLREDYDKLLSLAGEFKEPYLLQTPITDEYSGFSVAKLRNSNTSAIIEKFKYSKMNQGLFIDIFPIDNVEMETVNEDYDEIAKLAYENSTYMRLDNPYLDANDKKRVENYKGISNVEIFNKIQDICTKYKNCESQYKGAIAFNVYGCKKQMYPKDAFDDIVFEKFENLEVPIPKKYDEILSITYGDYMQMPPINQRKSVHNSYYRLDPDMPYYIR